VDNSAQKTIDAALAGTEGRRAGRARLLQEQSAAAVREGLFFF
jgi:hypothetical protein